MEMGRLVQAVTDAGVELSSAARPFSIEAVPSAGLWVR
jgi:hypothetical protein